ncbi:hypothetical protein QAD02_009530 [Eretmocerus hayati]|uniref:Uncharacterized protein n=1 Tax=Eretmocerus hayati TaxID=131215 RepID=A0ACC2N9V4_9HYME|nr:hypothetical protein QAD02_009530 [Eretmocerus hayati]
MSPSTNDIWTDDDYSSSQSLDNHVTNSYSSRNLPENELRNEFLGHLGELRDTTAVKFEENSLTSTGYKGNFQEESNVVNQPGYSFQGHQDGDSERASNYREMCDRSQFSGGSNVCTCYGVGNEREGGMKCIIEQLLMNSHDNEVRVNEINREAQELITGDTSCSEIIEISDDDDDDDDCVIQQIVPVDRGSQPSSSGTSAFTNSFNQTTRMAAEVSGTSSCGRDRRPSEIARVIDEILRFYHASQRRNPEGKH